MEIRIEITRITVFFFCYKESFFFQIGETFCSSKSFLIFRGAVLGFW